MNRMLFTPRGARKVCRAEIEAMLRDGTAEKVNGLFYRFKAPMSQAPEDLDSVTDEEEMDDASRTVYRTRELKAEEPTRRRARKART